jgi:molecular chaperone HscB
MALEELREGDASARPQLVAAQERFNGMLSESDSSLTTLFAAHDAGGAVLDQIRAALNRRRYVSNLVREVEKELNVPAAD